MNQTIKSGDILNMKIILYDENNTIVNASNLESFHQSVLTELN